MRNGKFDKKIEQAVMRLLDGAVRKHGLGQVRHAANKWSTGQREKVALAKQQKILEQRLAEVSKRLGR